VYGKGEGVRLFIFLLSKLSRDAAAASLVSQPSKHPTEGGSGVVALDGDRLHQHLRGALRLGGDVFQSDRQFGELAACALKGHPHDRKRRCRGHDRIYHAADAFGRQIHHLISHLPGKAGGGRRGEKAKRQNRKMNGRGGGGKSRKEKGKHYVFFSFFVFFFFFEGRERGFVVAYRVRALLAVFNNRLWGRVLSVKLITVG
jgi:hypothetical protein